MSDHMLREAQANPPILLSAGDYDRLFDLAMEAMTRYPSDDARLLLGELHRADTVPPDWMPPEVVAMNSHVEYRDERSRATRRVQLVYPDRVNISEGRISVLSLIGAALIGLEEGQAITCRTDDRGERRFTVLRVSIKPLADDPELVEADAKRRSAHRSRKRRRRPT